MIAAKIILYFLIWWGAPIAVGWAAIRYGRDKMFSNRWLTGVGLVLGVCGWLVFFSNRVSEDVRNALGSMLVPAALVWTPILVAALLNKRRPPIRMGLGLMSAFSLAGSIFYLGSAMLEDSSSLMFTILRVRSAKTISGQPISQAINRDDVYWTSGGHFHHVVEEPGFTAMKLEAKTGNDRTHYFAYHTRTHTLAPMADVTAEAFPKVMPPNDLLVDLELLKGTNQGAVMRFGDVDFKLPKKWFAEVMRR